MEIKVGSRWKSAVCATEVIVVRGSGSDVDLRCGGQQMLAHGATPGSAAEPDSDWAGGSLMGKRYADEEAGFEVLVTKAGAGSLSLGIVALPLKDAKALPSSD